MKKLKQLSLSLVVVTIFGSLGGCASEKAGLIGDRPFRFGDKIYQYSSCRVKDDTGINVTMINLHQADIKKTRQVRYCEEQEEYEPAPSTGRENMREPGPRYHERVYQKPHRPHQAVTDEDRQEEAAVMARERQDEDARPPQRCHREREIQTRTTHVNSQVVSSYGGHGDGTVPKFFEGGFAGLAQGAGIASAGALIRPSRTNVSANGGAGGSGGSAAASAGSSSASNSQAWSR